MPQALLGQARPAVLVPAGQRPERRPLRAALGTGDGVRTPPGLGFFLVAHQSVLGAGGMVGVPQTWGCNVGAPAAQMWTSLAPGSPGLRGGSWALRQCSEVQC